jgi:uncharacterized membrane protein
MSTPASIAGHPIHPILVTVPIGLWVFSLVSDIIFAAGLGGPVWHDVAFYTMAGGVVGALLAAVPGLVDFLSLRDSNARKVGAFHMILNLTLVALYAVNLWLRMNSLPRAVMPIALSVVAVVLLLVSGWLGGELVFKYGTGVAPRRDVPPAPQEHPRARAA